ncbi:metallophosphoesterase [Leptospira ognonensis]|uniref:Metallophosphoesterase n=2 Tax=Leptospira ognonensis TaxID=2484945 RepID=A0A4R9K9C6_9LEPT|nr:metallophosphoesterase [Leptospira ognonensis]TGL61318.1 metallophosphoesterase [Leptospira ognonensis]
MSNMTSFLKFLTVFTTILGSAYIYTGIRLVEGLSLSGLSVYLFWGAIIVLILIIPVSYFLSQVTASEWVQSFFSYFAFTGLGFFTILFSLVILKDLATLLFRLTQLSLWFTLPQVGEGTYFKFSISLGLIGVAILLTLYGFYQTHQKLKTVLVKIHIKDLHADLEGFTIVQISDVHIGPTIKGKFLNRVVARINHLDPDFVAITGDLVDGPASRLKQHLLPLGDLKSKYGTFYITGNHEYYSGVHAWISEIKKLGIQVLINENKVLHHQGATVTVAGVTDLKAGSIVREHATNPLQAIQGGENSDFKILLAHQPNSIFEAAGLGYDLQLSGHTHGGQYFPGNILIYLAQKFVAGLHTYKDMLIYVSRGTGYWGPPLRIGAPSEITKLVLSKA